MSKDIWHTADEAPKPYENIEFYVDGYLYSGCYEPQYNQYGIFGADKVERWCSSKDLSLYIPALETELERARKALGIAMESLDSIKSLSSGSVSYNSSQFNWAMAFAGEALDQIKQITESPAENVQTDAKSRPVNVQKKMSPEEFAELELLVNATFK